MPAPGANLRVAHHKPLWTNGTIPSETFTLLGTGGGAKESSPKTTSLLMFGAGFVGMVGIVRRKLG